MPWYLYIAIRHLFPQGKRLTFFTFMSVTGVALGVMLLVVVISVFNGFGHELRKIIEETSGDLKVSGGAMFEDYWEQIELLEADPMVEAAAPFAYGIVMMQSRNRPVFPAIQGIDLRKEKEVVPIDSYMVAGALDELDDDSIIVSSGVANVLGLRIGEEVDVYTPLMIERIKQDEILLPRTMRIVGVFETGFTRIDDNLIVTTLRTMQDLYGLGEAVHSIKIKTAEGIDPDKAAVLLQEKLEPPFRVSTWIESNEDFLAIIQFEKRMMFFLLLFIIIVGAFSITTSLLTTVVRKTREIGLFASMGATSRQITACFCFQGFWVGVAGTVLGFLIGFGILSMRDAITNAIFWLVGSKEQTLEFYFFSRLPVYSETSDMIVIAVFAVAIATLAGLLPAFKAGRLKPVEALRNE